MSAQAGQIFPLSALFEILQVDGKEKILPVLRSTETYTQQMQELQQQVEQLQQQNQQMQQGMQQMQQLNQKYRSALTRSGSNGETPNLPGADAGEEQPEVLNGTPGNGITQMGGVE